MRRSSGVEEIMETNGSVTRLLVGILDSVAKRQ